MKSLNSKRGQESIGLSFGVIFSIILIVVFVVFAFIGIKSFLDIGDTSSVGLFYQDLQKSVNDARSGQYSESNFKISLPSGIKEICFANLSGTITNPGEEYDAIKGFDIYDANVFLIPPQKAKGMEWKLINYINISKITRTENPYCVDVGAGLKIKKDFYDKWVVVE